MVELAALFHIRPWEIDHMTPGELARFIGQIRQQREQQRR